MSQKWQFEPKCRIKIRYFEVTFFESTFCIHFVGKTHILWEKSFKKIQDGSWNEKISLSRHLEQAPFKIASLLLVELLTDKRYDLDQNIPFVLRRCRTQKFVRTATRSLHF
jgi:hypothetical protein